MATTHRSEDEGTCKWCHGKLSIIVSRDPDEEVDCVCTDPPELAADDFQVCPTNLFDFEGKRLHGVATFRKQEVPSDV